MLLDYKGILGRSFNSTAMSCAFFRSPLPHIACIADAAPSVLVAYVADAAPIVLVPIAPCAALRSAPQKTDRAHF